MRLASAPAVTALTLPNSASEALPGLPLSEMTSRSAGDSSTPNDSSPRNGPAAASGLSIPDWPGELIPTSACVEALLRSGDWARYESQAREQLREAMRERWGVAPRLCCSGTAAMEIALRAAGIGPGDEVIVPAFDYPGNLRCVELVGAKPVLADVLADGVTLDPDGLESAAGGSVRGVIVSHLFGRAAAIEPIVEICDRYGWLLFEDACQVPGMRIGGQPAGTLGDLGTLSFGGGKPLTSGSGGALLINHPRIAARIGGLLDRPSDAFPLSPLQAAVLLPQLPKLDESDRRRLATVRSLNAEPEALASWEFLRSPQERVPLPVFYKLAWLAPSRATRDEIIRLAGSRGIPIGAGYRSAARMSGRRCRKPLPLTRSETLANRLCLLDHRALLVAPEAHGCLLQALREIHDQTRDT